MARPTLPQLAARFEKEILSSLVAGKNPVDGTDSPLLSELVATVEGTLLASAARTATATTANQDNQHARGVALFLNITAGAAAETLTPRIEFIDPVSGAVKSLTAFPATGVAATGAHVYVLHPDAVETVAVAQLEVQALPLPRTWRAVVAHSGVGSWTYSLGYSLLP